jgi:hypothetical protein
MDESDADAKLNQGKKEKKIEKMMIKSQRQQQKFSEHTNIAGTSHEINARQSI